MVDKKFAKSVLEFYKFDTKLLQHCDLPKNCIFHLLEAFLKAVEENCVLESVLIILLGKALFWFM